jgi:hypothetical protein
MKRQLTLVKPPRPTRLPDLSLHDGIVAPRVLDALRVASDQPTRVGIRHSLEGDLAVDARAVTRGPRRMSTSSLATRLSLTTVEGS